MPDGYDQYNLYDWLNRQPATDPASVQNALWGGPAGQMAQSDNPFAYLLKELLFGAQLGPSAPEGRPTGIEDLLRPALEHVRGKLPERKEAAPTAPSLAPEPARERAGRWGTTDELEQQIASMQQREPPSYPTDQQFSDPDRGIFFEEMPADKIRRIREQAAAKFPGATGGAFMSAEMTPEIEERERLNEAWLAGQPTRDAEFALQNALMRRDVEGAKSAADALMSLGRAEYYQQQPYSAARAAQIRGEASGGITDNDLADYLLASVKENVLADPKQTEAVTQAIMMLREGRREEANRILQSVGLYPTGGMGPTQPTAGDMAFDEQGRPVR